MVICTIILNFFLLMNSHSQFFYDIRTWKPLFWTLWKLCTLWCDCLNFFKFSSKIVLLNYYNIIKSLNTLSASVSRSTKNVICIDIKDNNNYTVFSKAVYYYWSSGFVSNIKWSTVSKVFSYSRYDSIIYNTNNFWWNWSSFTVEFESYTN